MYLSLVQENQNLVEKALSVFFDDLVIFSHFKVSGVDPGAEFPRAAVAAGNLTGVSKQQPLISCYPEKRRSQPH